MKLEAVMVTDVGVVRDHNEDSAHVDAQQRFFIVADGMGGHAAGEVASAMAVETVKKTLESSTSIIEGFAARPTDNARRALVQLLQSAVLAAHQAVYQRGSKESDKAGMGTTLDVLLIAGQEAFVAHVGDSRTYLIRDGKAAQLTTDHTVAEVLVIEGKLTIEEALVSPYRTVLVNAIGVAADVGVEMAHLQLRKGDKLLICSDGLHDYFLAEQEIADTLGPAEATAAGLALGGMVETAKERGGHDNITGVVISVVDLAEAVPAAIEQDQTLPVDVPVIAAGWNDDERTENISPKELDRIGGPPGIPRPSGKLVSDEDGGRRTAPMGAVDEAGTPVTGTEQTDPKIVIKPPGPARGEDATEPALDAAVVKAALVRAQMMGTSKVGGEDPTDPGTDGTAIRATIGRASTEPPPLDGDGEDSGETTIDRRTGPEADKLALDETGPSPKVEPDGDDRGKGKGKAGKAG